VDEETIRVIIHEGNCHALFQTEFQKSLISTLMQKKPTPRRAKNRLCDNTALPYELGFVPHQVSCNYHIGRSGARSNQATASMAHECVTVGRAVFC
jgi:hypothetical protein